jgi:hypothetical protein
MTDQAVWKRLHRCTSFLAALLQQLLPLDELPPLPPPFRFLACDGTTMQRPGATSADYRLHLVMDVVTLRFHEVHISDHKRGERLQNYHLQPGDVAIVDQGYCSYGGILESVCTQGADIIVRWNHQRPLYDPQVTTRALDLCTVLKNQQPGTIARFPVQVKYAEDRKNKDKRTLVGMLHVYRMTAKEAQEAQRKVSRKQQKKQRKLSEKTLFLRQFVFVFTSLSAPVFSGETVLALYRCRWQIELAIKRLKSLLNIHKLRAKRGSQLAEVYLYGTVLYLLLVDQEMRTTFSHVWGGLDQERPGTWWRLYKLVKARLDAFLIARGNWRQDAVSACLHVLMERPRKRKLQSLPRRVVELQHCLAALSEAA